MVPNVNQRGHSFMGVSAYLLYGELGQENAERVEWASTHNLLTNDIETSARVMAWTDSHSKSIRNQWRDEQGLEPNSAGRPATAGNVYHYSLSWKDGQAPTREEMEQAGHASIERLGLSEHQYYIVAHGDTDHQHLHIVANLVHPENGSIANVGRDYKKLDRWANEYEKEHEIVCDNRAKKYEAWEQDKQAFIEPSQSIKERKAIYKEQLTRAYETADSGKAFLNAVDAQGLELAWSDKNARGGFVVVDNQGEVYGLTRLIEGAKKRDISALLKEIDTEELQRASDVSKSRMRAFKDLQQQQQQESKEHEQEQEQEQRPIAEAKQAFNQKAKEGKAKTAFNKGASEQPTARDIQGEAPKSTEERARAILHMARNPLHDLYSGLDKAGAEKRKGLAGNDSLLAGQGRSETINSSLRQMGGKKAELEGWFDNEEVARIKEEIDKLNIPRYVRLKEIKEENAKLKNDLSAEMEDREKYLRSIDSEEEEKHRAKWQGKIDNEQAQIDEIARELNKRGFMAFVYRLRYGAEMREEQEARGKNIDSHQRRLNDGVGLLSWKDHAELASLEQTHRKASEKLRSEQREDLQAIEATRAEKEQEILQQAQAMPSQAGELKSAVDTKSKDGKEQLVKIEQIEHSHQAERETTAPDDGRREHEGKRETSPQELEAHKQEQLAQMREDFISPPQKKGWFPHRDNEEERAEQLAEYGEELEGLGYDEEQRREIIAEMEAERERERLQGLEQDQGYDM